MGIVGILFFVVVVPILAIFVIARIIIAIFLGR